jgi:hypothetical protein
MSKIEYAIQLDDGQFWKTSNNGNSQEKANFAHFDSIANGFKWSMAVVGGTKRKLTFKSVTAKSIYAMLDYVVAELKADCTATVVCMTPDVEITFIN